MDRAVLLALLGIPIVIGIHAACVMFATVDRVGNRLHWQARFQSPQQTIPAWFVVEHTA